MAIKFEGKVFKLRVQPGPEGLQRFKDQVRQLVRVRQCAVPEQLIQMPFGT